MVKGVEPMVRFKLPFLVEIPVVIRHYKPSEGTAILPCLPKLEKMRRWCAGPGDSEGLPSYNPPPERQRDIPSLHTLSMDLSRNSLTDVGVPSAPVEGCDVKAIAMTLRTVE